MNPEQWLSLKWNGGSTMSDRWLNQSKIIQLTKRKRDVILLSYFMGMSDAEIARKMKLVRSTVNEHRKRSLEILKDVMEEKADESEM